MPWTEFKKQYFIHDYCNRREKTNGIPLNKRCKSFKHWDKLGGKYSRMLVERLGHQDLLLGAYVNQMLKDRGLSFLRIPFQSDGSQVFEKDVPGLKVVRG